MESPRRIHRSAVMAPTLAQTGALTSERGVTTRPTRLLLIPEYLIDLTMLHQVLWCCELNCVSVCGIEATITRMERFQ